MNKLDEILSMLKSQAEKIRELQSEVTALREENRKIIERREVPIAVEKKTSSLTTKTSATPKNKRGYNAPNKADKLVSGYSRLLKTSSGDYYYQSASGEKQIVQSIDDEKEGLIFATFDTERNLWKRVNKVGQKGVQLYQEIGDEFHEVEMSEQFNIVEDPKKRGIRYYLNALKGKQVEVYQKGSPFYKLVMSNINDAIRHMKANNPAFRTGVMSLNIRVKIEPSEKDYIWFSLREMKDPINAKEVSYDINSQAEKYTNSDKFAIIDTAYIVFIPIPAGGCYKNSAFHHDFKVGHIGDVKISNPRSDNNNCFFYCLKAEFKAKGIKVGKRVCNEMRKEYGMKKDCLIDIEMAKRIAKDKLNLDIGIINQDKDYFGKQGDKTLMLVDEHYMLVKGMKTVCERCGKEYVNKHDPSMCTTRALLAVNKANGDKFVIPSRLRPVGWDEKNNEMMHTLHYDIETYKLNSYGQSEPNVVGYCWRNPTGSVMYETLTGKDCMDKFVQRLRADDMKHIEFINAFNGSAFDHLYLIRAENKHVKLSAIEPLKTGGGIIRSIIAGKTTVDIKKHLQGSLASNLKEFGCTVSKGDFDHTKNNAWEELDEDTREELLTYLKSDVLGLMELSEKLHEEMMNEYGTSWVHYISTSQLSYALWKDSVNSEYLQDGAIMLPTYDQWEMINKAIYGGRTQVHRKYYESVAYADVEKNKHNLTKELFDDIQDYLVDEDVNSLYPFSMTFDFPCGKPYEVSEYDSERMGVYEVRYKANRNLVTPVLPRKTKEGIQWDLEDGEGYYTSVDIQSAMRFGYTFEIKKGLVWPEKGKVFDGFINKLSERKQKAKKGSVKYLLAKLFMNSLYGKTIQRPRFEQTFFVNEASDWNKILPKYYIQSIDCDNGLDSWLVVGSVKDPVERRKKINKPSHLGAFILSYSRRVMIDYMEAMNPDRKVNEQFYYTDTDSIQVHVDQARRVDLTKKGLGYLSNDLGENSKIVRGIWVAPKMYLLEYLTLCEDGSVKMKEHIVGKGVKDVKKVLKKDDYEAMMDGREKRIVNKDVFKRNAYKLNSKEKEKGVSCFSVTISDCEKVLNRMPWCGREVLEDGINTIPWGCTIINECQGDK